MLISQILAGSKRDDYLHPLVQSNCARLLHIIFFLELFNHWALGIIYVPSASFDVVANRIVEWFARWTAGSNPLNFNIISPACRFALTLAGIDPCMTNLYLGANRK